MRNVIGLIQLVKLHILLFVDVFFPCQKSLRRQTNHIFDNVTTQKKEGKTKSRKKYNEKKIVL